MDNTEKLLRAFIEAQGFEVEEVSETFINGEKYQGSDPLVHFTPMDTVLTTLNHKVTKRGFKSKPTLHKIVREYERGNYTASEMIGRIMLLEGVEDEDL